MTKYDHEVLHRLAEQYAAICAQDVQNERRALWRQHNSLIKTRVPILCSWYWGSNVEPSLLAAECVCKDPYLRRYEHWLRNMIFHATVGDDHVFEPWITVRAALQAPASVDVAGDAVWGIAYERARSAEAGGQAFVTVPAIQQSSDLAKIVATPHVVDEEETARRVARLQDAVGDLLTVNVDRSPLYQYYGGNDLSTALGYLVGIGPMLVLMYDDPELLHQLLAFMRDAVLAQYDQAARAGDWSLTNNFNMGMPYAQDLPLPSANSHGTRLDQLWLFMSAQEFTSVSPGMFREFMLDYQAPIMEQFGLVSYGCCEDLTDKIGVLRRIPNLRRIGIAPRADVARCAEQIEDDYVLSWKPNPAMICVGFDREAIRQTIRAGLEAARGCIVDIMLKDISTVEGHPERLRQWTEVVRDVAAAF